MISFGERCYPNQYDEISDDEFSDDEISGFANTTKFLTTKFLTTKFPPPLLITLCLFTTHEKYSAQKRKRIILWPLYDWSVFVSCITIYDQMGGGNFVARNFVARNFVVKNFVVLAYPKISSSEISS